MLAQRCSIAAPLALCAVLGLTACGGSSPSGQAASATHSSTTQPGPSPTQASQPAGEALAAPGAPPSTIVASVAGKPITLGVALHLMALRSAQTPLPDPPSYSGCIARLKGAGGATAGQTQAALKQSCAQQYQQLLSSALSSAIHAQWLLGEGAEEHLSVSPGEVQAELQLNKRAFHTEAEFEAYRKSSGQSIADMSSEIRLGKLSDQIFKAIASKEHPATSAEVARYYEAHRKRYAIPAGRTVRIIRTATEPSALKVREELKAGKSYAAIVKQLSAIAQPITAQHGEVADLLPGLYGEKNLNDAIFTAKLNRLYGPVKVTTTHRTIAPESGTGFYVFEVKKLIPGRQRPLSSVKGAIAEELTKTSKDQTLATFVAAFKSKWTARTDCKAGYVVANCRQFKAPKGGSVGDRYTL